MNLIPCQRRHLDERALERGYDPAAVRDCIIAEDGDAITVDTDHPAYPKARPAPAPVADPWRERGPKLWAELHGCPTPTREWLNAFTARIGCGDCKRHWLALLKEIPPAFGAGWFAWTIAAHNAVNRRIGKPAWDEAQARTRWNVPPTHPNAVIALARKVCEACPHCLHVHQTRASKAQVKCAAKTTNNGFVPLSQFLLKCPLKKPLAEPGAPAATPPAEPFRVNVERRGRYATPSASDVSFPVDLVYLWVDGADPAWEAAYRKHVGGDPMKSSRFASADELKYALRSVAEFAPWVNRIFIVTADQRPAWLADHPKVRVVSHSEIIPAQHLPTFNSQAIEPHIWKIEGLAEHFLYANDDMIFGAPVKPGHFFTSDGKAKMRLSGRVRNEGSNSFRVMKNHAADVLDAQFGVKDWRCGWHHVKPYTRSMFADLERRIGDLVDVNTAIKARQSKNIAWNCGLWPAFSVEAGYAVEMKRSLQCFYVQPGDADARRRMADAIRGMPHLICVNNGVADTVGLVKEWLGAYFPNRSVFEKEAASFDLTVITPTGDRPEAFALCQRWMRRQTFAGRVQWVVVDDGQSPTPSPVNMPANWTVQYIRRERKPSDPAHTLPVQLLVGLDHAESERIAVIEDDDWYRSDYLAVTFKRLDHHALVGESNTPAYWLTLPGHWLRRARGNASLAGTAVRGSEAIRLMRSICKSIGTPLIDMRLWKTAPDHLKKVHATAPPLVVQVKHPDPRPGVIRSHNATEMGTVDPDMSSLKAWIGSDVEYYRRFAPAPGRPAVSFQTPGGMGDWICFLAAVREYARQHPEQAVYLSNLADIIGAYGDNLVRPGKAVDHRNIRAVHREKFSSTRNNYVGTFLRELCPEITEPRRPELPVFSDLGEPIIVIQPRSNFAKNPPKIYVQRIVDRVIQLTGKKVYAIGAGNTNRDLAGVDYSLLANSGLQMVRNIARAELVLTPRSFSAHLAAGYQKPTLCWMPDDGENWHLDYPDWPARKVLWCEGNDPSLTAVAELVEMIR